MENLNIFHRINKQKIEIRSNKNHLIYLYNFTGSTAQLPAFLIKFSNFFDQFRRAEVNAMIGL